MSAPTTTPDTIVFVHGFWVTPRSWENWMARFEARGYRVLAPWEEIADSVLQWAVEHAEVPTRTDG